MPEATVAIPVTSDDPKKKKGKEGEDGKFKFIDEKEPEDLVRPSLLFRLFLLNIRSSQRKICSSRTNLKC
jgi:hypothetical protein